MATPAQSINAIQGQTKKLHLEHETTFGSYSAKLLIGKRHSKEELSLVAEIELDVVGGFATGTLLVDMAPGVYETQLVLTDSISSDEDAAFGPVLVVKARVGGWPESP